MAGHKYPTIKNFVLLLIVVAPLFSLGLFNHGLWSADEPRVAEIGREMALKGNWAVPTLNQKPFLEEPPLYYGFLALTFKAFGGASDHVARIPSTLFALAGILVMFFIANFLFGPRVALLSGIILATSEEYIRVAHWVLVDSTLTFFVISAMGLFITGYLSESNRKRLLCYIFLYVACSLAFFTKGFIGIVIPGLSILTFLVVEKNLKEILKMRPWLGIPVFIFLTIPWFIALWHQGGTDYLNVFLLQNNLERFIPISMAEKLSKSFPGHRNPFYYYLFEFPAGFFPWSILIVPTLTHAFSKAGRLYDVSGISEMGRRFIKCWFFPGIILLSVASTKRTLYLLPLFAPFVMITALFIDHTLVSKPLNKIGKVFLWIINILLLVAGLGLTPLYLYIKKMYLSAIPDPLYASVITISVLVTALSISAIRYLWRENMKRFWISVCLSIIAAFAFILVSVFPVLDFHKNFVPFCQQIMDRVPADQPLYAFRPDETLRGAVPFYTGRFMIEMEDLKNVEAILQKNEPSFIVTRDQGAWLEKELLSTEKLHLLVKQEMGTGRTLLLLSNKVQSPFVIPDPFRKRR